MAKSSWIKIEKDLLAGYSEAVADMKRVKLGEITLEEVIEKHSDRIRGSEAWE